MGNVAQSFAEEICERADLGDSRARRLVHLATEAAVEARGRVLELCQTSASRQGAYELLSNRSVAPRDVQAAATRATGPGCETLHESDHWFTARSSYGHVTLDMVKPATGDRLRRPLNVVTVREVGRNRENVGNSLELFSNLHASPSSARARRPH